MSSESREAYIQEFFQYMQEDVIEPASEEDYWDFRQESYNKWHEEYLVGEGNSGELMLQGEMNGYILFSYRTDGFGFSDEVEGAAESLDSRISDMNSDLPEMIRRNNRITITFDVEEDLDNYGEEVSRYLRDFVHLAEHADKRI